MSETNHWKTIAIVKSTSSKIVAGINNKGRRLQVVFGTSDFDHKIEGRYLPLPSSCDAIDLWAQDMRDIIDAIAARAKEAAAEMPAKTPEEQGPERTHERHRRRDRGPKGLRSLARQDAERVGAAQDLSQKEDQRKEKTKPSKHERSQRDREIREKMRSGRKGS